MAVEAEVQAAQRRVRDRYLALSLIATEHNCADRLDGWLARDVSPEVARREALERNRSREELRGALTMSERERSEYNLAGTLLSLAAGRQPSGLAVEISSDIATRE